MDISSGSPTETLAPDVRRGVENLLVDCAGVKAGDRVLVVMEDPSYGYFDPAAPRAVAAGARDLGAETILFETRRIDGPDHVPQALSAAMHEVDHTIFFNRIGDQMRFRDLPGQCTKTICYAFDVGALSSDFCTAPHALYTEMLDLLQSRLDAATEYHITCPRGTDLRGAAVPLSVPGASKLDFTLKLFPVTVHRPILCSAMTGRLVIERWVTGTNTHVYDPEVCRLDTPVTAIVKDGRLEDLEGDSAEVRKLWAHYDMVGETFGIDQRNFHSWHAGVNPRTFYTADPSGDPVRWHGVVFASPRDVHFHTVGDYAPGEISIHVLDHTTSFDGNPYWRDGRLAMLDEPEFQSILQRHGASPDIFETRRDIGI